MSIKKNDNNPYYASVTMFLVLVGFVTGIIVGKFAGHNVALDYFKIKLIDDPEYIESLRQIETKEREIERLKGQR